jgi:hypothetical protein
MVGLRVPRIYGQSGIQRRARGYCEVTTFAKGTDDDHHAAAGDPHVASPHRPRGHQGGQRRPGDRLPRPGLGHQGVRGGPGRLPGAGRQPGPDEHQQLYRGPQLRLPAGRGRARHRGDRPVVHLCGRPPGDHRHRGRGGVLRHRGADPHRQPRPPGGADRRAHRGHHGLPLRRAGRATGRDLPGRRRARPAGDRGRRPRHRHPPPRAHGRGHRRPGLLQLRPGQDHDHPGGRGHHHPGARGAGGAPPAAHAGSGPRDRGPLQEQARLGVRRAPPGLPLTTWGPSPPPSAWPSCRCWTSSSATASATAAATTSAWPASPRSPPPTPTTPTSGRSSTSSGCRARSARS